jgi:hypothetical protein
MGKLKLSLFGITGLAIILVVLVSSGISCNQPIAGSQNQNAAASVNKVNNSSPGSDSTRAHGEGLAIYLTRDDVPPETMKVLSHIDLADQPLLSLPDIITYNAQTHELKLTDGAFARISQMEVPVRGKSFLVCIDKASIYGGAFWTPISSISFNGVTIWKPLSSRGPNILTLELGYPASTFYGGPDPRNDDRVLKSLKSAGKLIDRLLISDNFNLPMSFKGYELYSWKEEDIWHFTLISGTNRTKTMSEITSHEDYLSEAGWVKIQVTDVEAIKKVLSLLPRGQSIFWSGEPHLEQATPSCANLQLPPGQIVEAIRSQAEKDDLKLSITAR